jgi:hypothetical protein
MTDSIRFLDRHTEVVAGSIIHGAARRGGGGDYDELAVTSSDGTLVGLKHGVVHRDGVVAVTSSPHGVCVTTTCARDPRHPRTPNVTPPTCAEELGERFDLMQQHLEVLGLRMDLREAALSRVDVFKDVVLDRPYGDYIPGLEACDLQRLSPSDLASIKPFDVESMRRSKRPLCEHTYGRLLTEHAVVLYSKSAHIAGSRRHQEYASRVGYTLGGQAVARFEGRFLKARAVRKKLGVATGADLIASWDRIGEKFVGLVEDTLKLPERAGTAPTGGPMTRLETLTKSGYGRGKKLVWADLAIAMAGDALRRGPLDIEGLRAKYSAAGVRKCDIDEVLGCLLTHISPSENGTAWDALGDLRDRLSSNEAFVWPNPKK